MHRESYAPWGVSYDIYSGHSRFTEKREFEAIAEAIANEAKAKGNEIKTFKLNQLKARGCQSCYGCKKAGKCVVKDDMIEVLTP